MDVRLFFLMKTRPVLKMYLLFARINYIHKIVSKGSVIWPTWETLDACSICFIEERIKWESWRTPLVIVFITEWLSRLLLKQQSGPEKQISTGWYSHFSLSVGYNFTNGNSRLGRGAAAELELELQFSDYWFGFFLWPIAASQ